MYEENALYLVKHSHLGAKKKQYLRKNCSKNTKMATTACKFSKNFRGSIPSDPPRALFILKIILLEKIRLKICENLVPPY